MGSRSNGPGAAATAAGAEDVGLADATTSSTAHRDAMASQFGLPPDPVGERDHTLILAAWRKPGRQTIFVIVGIRVHRGRTRLDIREWIDGYRPTSKGMSLPAERIETLGSVLLNLNAG